MIILSLPLSKLLRTGIIFCGIVLCTSLKCLAQPVIAAFSPTSGPVGTPVTITGANFSAIPANNIVFIGGIKANVTGATTTALTATVPAGATFLPINVTVNGLTAYSGNPFVVTFSGAESQFTYQSFEYTGRVDSVDSAIETTKFAIGDIDDDKRIDVVTVDRLHNTLSVYRNTTTNNGNVSFASKIDLTTGQSPRAVAIGDIDGDGKPDVIVTNLSDNTVSVLKNTTNGGIISFATKVDFATATQPAGISVTDVDKDGKPDLVINTINLDGYVSILKNIGSIGTVSFASRIDIQSFGGSIEEIRTADMDSDGKPDILLPDFASNVIKIFRNASSVGNISFIAAGTLNSSINPDNIEIGDFNNDGKPDLAISHYSNDRVWFYKNISTTGNIALEFSNSYPTSNSVNGLAIGDLDGDAKLDIAVNGEGNFLLFKNTSSAGSEITFDSPSPFSAPFASHGICGDFDSDGKLDIAGNTGIYRVAIWKNVTARPKISSFSPSSGKTGDTITINGSNFTGTTSINFGTVPAVSFTVENETTITAIIGTGATGDVKVVTASGSGKLSGFLFLGPPVISDFTPASAATYDTVFISGQNFISTTSVEFGGVLATFHVLNPFTIRAYIAGGASGEVSVTNAYGAATKPGFIYIPKPFISSFSPVEVVTGTNVTIKGFNFSGTTSVSFGDIPAASFTVMDATTIKAIVGNGSSGKVKIITSYGVAEKTELTYYSPPVISSFTPAEAAQGDVVTIIGTNLAQYYNGSYVTSVKFGGSEAFSFQIIDTSTINAQVYEGASGAVTIESNRGDTSMPGFTFIPKPFITSVSPRIVGPGSEVTITGQNLTRTTAVTLGDFSASSFTIVSDTIIKAIVGTGANGYATISTPRYTAQGDWVEYTSAPLIYSVSPTSGPVGTTVTISGINFQSGADNNTVYFGGVKANVLSATATQVMVNVPPCAGYKPISVISQTTRLAASSQDRFNVTFPVDADAFNNNSFAGKINFATGVSPRGVKHADVDNDGRPDIVVINSGSTFVSVYKNLSSPGRLSFSPRMDIEIGMYAKALAVGDVDGDGKLDLAISNDIGDDDAKIYIFRNQSTLENITFVKSCTIGNTLGELPYFVGDLAISDFNLDGRPDIASLCTNCRGEGRIHVSRNTSSNGSISFAETVTYNYYESGYSDNGIGEGLTVADLNHDDKPDVLVGMWGSSALYAFINISHPGEFISFNATMPASSLPYYSSSYYTLTPYIAMLDSDPYPDVVSGSFVFQNSRGAFSEASKTIAWYASFVYDLNGDGKQDILGYSDKLLLLKNTSAINSIVFEPAFLMDVTASSIVEAGDLDGDSKPEICLVYSSNYLTILRNRMGEETPSEPAINSVSPQMAAYSDQVLIKGSNLDQVTSVTFGNIPALYFTIVSQDSILATVGNGASGSVSVTTPGGTASLNGFTFIHTPAITSFTPKQGVSGTTVTISGFNFNDVSEVSFGDVTASSFTVESPESIVAVIGNGASGNVSITTPIGTGTRGGFTFYSQPVISDFSPRASASGGVVTLYGSNFGGVASVSFGGIPASSFTVNSTQEITATVGTGASGSVAVTNPAGTSSLIGFAFIYPTITTFTPTSASTGTTVTIKGHFFSGATAVSFGGVAASQFTVVNDEIITAIIDSGASGNVSVTTPDGVATLDGFVYREITAVDPDDSRTQYLMVHPNPTHDILIIDHPAIGRDATLLVVDMLGRKVKTIMPAYNTMQTETSMANLSPGIYTIIWSEGIHKLSRIFVVQ